jgi:hypothetical protein
MGFGYAFMSPPPPGADKNGSRAGKKGEMRKAGQVPGGPGAASQLPARSVGGGYSPPLEVLVKAVLAADWAAEAAEAGEADPARAPFTFW